MKKIVLILLLFVVSINFFNAQTTTKGMKYQAVARDLSGLELSNKPISLQIVLVGDIKSSTIYYSEFHNVITNEFGLFSLNIGEGKVDFGEFNTIPWSKENIWIEVNVMKEGDNYYSPLSKSKLLAVPYAYHAATANALTNNDKLRKPGVPSQNWSLFGNRNTNPDKDKLGTTDLADLVVVTNDVERVRILSTGEMEVRENAQFDKNINIDNITKTDYLIVADEANDTIQDPYPRFGSIAEVRGLLIADSIAIKGGLDIGGNLSVHGDRVDIDKDLYVGRNVHLNTNDQFSPQGETVNHGKFTSNGQVTINTLTPLTGGDSNYDAYPLRVEGSNQGIAVKVNGERNTSKNFVTFWDDFGIHGRIEGQTSEELHDSFQYIWDNVMSGLDVAFILAEGVACGFQLDFGEVGVMAAEGAGAGAQWAELNINANDNVGVAFESGSGDYAEWLEKASLNETFSYGDIVGVSGGKISKNKQNATHFMVVSKSPIVLGNMPAKGNESNFEKIAFMGQVPVKVRGKVEVGDYIIASKLNDGIGIAVNPKYIKLNQFEQIVGVAWSPSQNSSGFSMVNCAVGINTNDAVAKLKQQNEELNQVKGQMNIILSYLKSKDESFDAELFKIYNKETITVDTSFKIDTQNQFDTNKLAEQFDKILLENPGFIKQIQENARKSLDEKGVNYNLYDQTRRLVTDESYLLELFNEHLKY